MLKMNILKAEMKKVLYSIPLLLLYTFYLVLLIFTYKGTALSMKNYYIRSPYASGMLLSCNLFGSIVVVIFSSLICYKDYNANMLFIYSTILKRKTFLFAKQILIFCFSLFCSVTSLFLGLIFDISIKADMLGIGLLIIQLFSIVFVEFLYGILAFTIQLLTRNLAFSIIFPVVMIFFESVVHMYAKKVLLIKGLIMFNVFSLLQETFQNLGPGSIIIVPDNPYYNSSLTSFFILLLYITILVIFQFSYVQSEKFASK